MKRMYGILALAAGLAFAGCSASSTGTPDQTGSGKPVDQSEKYAGPTNAEMQGQPKNNLGLGISDRDENFMRDAHAVNLFEIREGNLAVSKTNDPQIRSLAQHLLDDHSKADDQLTSLAAKKGISNLGGMNSTQTSSASQLEKLSGQGFDREYLRQQRTGHEQTISEFQSSIPTIKDSDLKDWAQMTLPVLQEHLNMINARWNAIPDMNQPVPQGGQ